MFFIWTHGQENLHDKRYIKNIVLLDFKRHCMVPHHQHENKTLNDKNYREKNNNVMDVSSSK